MRLFPEFTMNFAQELWWQQASSDHEILILLRRNGSAPCQQLHYLQMVTEKLGKAYFWRNGSPPPKRHTSFVRFLQLLDDRSRSEVETVAKLFGFGSRLAFENWIRQIAPLAHELERLAPSLAGENAPNTEYPWPHATPVATPASHSFPVWRELNETGRGRQLLKVLDAAVLHFPKYA